MGVGERSKSAWLKMPFMKMLRTRVYTGRLDNDSHSYRWIYQEFRLFADLAAERPFAAEREGKRIIVEVKTFAGLSFIKEVGSRSAWPVQDLPGYYF